jgi:uncharacterized membrane protein YoaT (DUF817 family)
VPTVALFFGNVGSKPSFLSWVAENIATYFGAWQSAEKAMGHCRADQNQLMDAASAALLKQQQTSTTLLVA